MHGTIVAPSASPRYGPALDSKSIAIDARFAINGRLFRPFFPDSDEAAMSHLDALTRTDPEIAQLIRDEETSTGPYDPSHPVGKLRFSRGHGSDGDGADEQILRGLPGKALLRGAAEHRPDRDAGHRACESAFRRAARQRPAVFGITGEPGGLPGSPEARGDGHGAEPAVRRPPHARLESQLLRDHLSLRPVRARPP
jgi:hypothetical protein